MSQSLPKKELDWEKILVKARPSIILAVAGMVLISAGILSFLVFQQRETEIEILSVGETESGSTFLVDLEGAVEKPGVYELPGGARLNDLLSRAGGLSAGADREWVEKNLNLAQNLEDGKKIYIPKKGESGSSDRESGEVAGAKIVNKINVNTASANELDSLWGVGAKRAADIIESRPYSSTEELLSRKIIPSNVYERIKEEISVY